MSQTFKQFLIEGVATTDSTVDIAVGHSEGNISVYRLPTSSLAVLYRMDDGPDINEYIIDNGKFIGNSEDDGDVFFDLSNEDIDEFRYQLKGLTESADYLFPKGATVTVVKRGNNFDGKTGKVVSVHTATRGYPADNPHVLYGVKIGGEGQAQFFNGTQLKGAQSLEMKVPDRKHFKEGKQQKARWKKTRGPNDVPGYELDIPSESGGWKTLGFKMTNTMPTTSGKIKLYHGATGKDVWYDLSYYTFED